MCCKMKCMMPKKIKGFEDFIACKSQSLLLGNFKEDTHNFGGLYKQEGSKNFCQPHFHSFIDWLVQQLDNKTQGGLESR